MLKSLCKTQHNRTNNYALSVTLVLIATFLSAVSFPQTMNAQEPSQGDTHESDPLKLISNRADHAKLHIRICGLPGQKDLVAYDKVIESLESEFLPYIEWISDGLYSINTVATVHSSAIPYRVHGISTYACPDGNWPYGEGVIRQDRSNTNVALWQCGIHESKSGMELAFYLAGRITFNRFKASLPTLTTCLLRTLDIPPTDYVVSRNNHNKGWDIASVSPPWPNGTPAINRYALGWINPKKVEIHASGSFRYTLGPTRSDNTQILAFYTPSNPESFVSLGVRVTSKWDAIPIDGIEMVRVDKTPGCSRSPYTSLRGTRCQYGLAPVSIGLPESFEEFLREFFLQGGLEYDNLSQDAQGQYIARNFQEYATEVEEWDTAVDKWMMLEVDEWIDLDEYRVSVLERDGDSFIVNVTPLFSGRFSDDDASVHEENIEAIAATGITIGCSATGSWFCPNRIVTRTQMAAFVIRAKGIEIDTTGQPVTFSDVNVGSTLAPYIAKITELGIIPARSSGIFDPQGPVTRADMARILVRSIDSLQPIAEPQGLFQDIEGTSLTSTAEAIYEAGITRGCSTDPLLYCPEEPVTRDQMASFLSRAFNLRS